MNAYALWKEIDSLSESLMSPTVGPRVDVAETAAKYELVAELPGFTKDEVQLQVKEGILELTARKKDEAAEVRWLLRERRLGPVHRSFRLPRDVDGDAIEASFRDGLLVLTLPKKEEAKPRSVPIQAA